MQRRVGNFWRSNSLQGSATFLANVGSFLFLVMVARSTDPAVFGALGALAGIMLLFEVPSNALQVLVTKAVLGNRRENDPADGLVTPLVLGPLLVDGVIWGLGVCLILLALSPLLHSFLHLPTESSALLLAAYAIPVAIALVPKGALVAQLRRGAFSLALLSGISTRLVVGILLVHRGAGLDGALAAMIAGETVTALIGLVSLKGLLGPQAATGPVLRLRWRDAKNPAIGFTGYWLFTSIDIITARHWLNNTSSGWYAAAATAAQVVMVLPGAIAARAFPRFAAQGKSRRSLVALSTGSLAVASVGALAILITWGFSSTVITTLFDSFYLPAASIVGMLTVAGALMGITTILLHFHLARGVRLPSSICWIGTAVIVAFTTIWHHSPWQIAIATTCASGAVCIAMMTIALSHAHRADSDVIEQANLALLDADLDLTVVVPYYNPGPAVGTNMRKLLEVLSRSGATYEIIAVSDGSTDGSERYVDEISDPALINMVLPRNQGKGAALRIALARGRGRYLGFIDADGDLDPVLFETFHAMVTLYTPEIILGSKRHPLSDIYYPPLRRLYSWGFQQLVRLLFRLNIRDTQTGIKLIRRDLLSAVLPRMLEKRFAFDLELFVIARRLGYKRFLEAPIRLAHQFNSTISFKSVRRTLVDVIAIFWRLRVLHWYDGDRQPATRQEIQLKLDPIIPRAGVSSSISVR